MRDPIDLYSEFVFTSFKKNNESFPKENLDSLKSQVLSYFNLKTADLIFDDITVALEKMKQLDVRVRINVFSKKRESLFKTNFDQSDLDFSIQTLEFSEPRLKVKLKTFLGLRDPSLQNLKISNYAGALFHRRLAQAESYDDVLYISTENEVLEASTSNIVFRSEQGWVTPKRFVYQGVTRKKLLDSNKINESIITIKDLNTFSDAFLLNSVEGVVSIASIDEKYFFSNENAKEITDG